MRHGLATAGIALAAGAFAAPLMAEPIRYTCDGTRIVIDTEANLYRINGGAYTPMSWTFDGAWLRVLPRDGRKRLGFDVVNGDLLMGAESFRGACRAENVEAVFRLESGGAASLRAAFIGLPQAHRRQVQAALRSRGLYRGDLDGLWGSDTLQGILAHAGDGARGNQVEALRVIADLRNAGACLEGAPDGYCGGPAPAGAQHASAGSSLVAQAEPPAPAPVVIILGQGTGQAAPYAAVSGSGQVVYLADPTGTQMVLPATAQPALPPGVAQQNPAGTLGAPIPGLSPAAPSLSEAAAVRVASLGDLPVGALPAPSAAFAPAVATAGLAVPTPVGLDVDTLKRRLGDDRTRVQRDAFWSEVEGAEVQFVGRVDDVRPKSLLQSAHVRLRLEDGAYVGCVPGDAASVDLGSISIDERYVCRGKLSEYVKIFGEIGFTVEGAVLQRL